MLPFDPDGRTGRRIEYIADGGAGDRRDHPCSRAALG